jgi:hypothetical protein
MQEKIGTSRHCDVSAYHINPPAPVLNVRWKKTCPVRRVDLTLPEPFFKIDSAARLAKMRRSNLLVLAFVAFAAVAAVRAQDDEEDEEVVVDSTPRGDYSGGDPGQQLPTQEQLQMVRVAQ